MLEYRRLRALEQRNLLDLDFPCCCDPRTPVQPQPVNVLQNTLGRELPAFEMLVLLLIYKYVFGQVPYVSEPRFTSL